MDFDQVTTFKDHKKAQSMPKAKGSFSQAKPAQASKPSMKAPSGKKRA